MSSMSFDRRSSVVRRFKIFARLSSDFFILPFSFDHSSSLFPHFLFPSFFLYFLSILVRVRSEADNTMALKAKQTSCNLVALRSCPVLNQAMQFHCPPYSAFEFRLNYEQINLHYNTKYPNDAPNIANGNERN